MAFYQMESLRFYILKAFIMNYFGVRDGKIESNLPTQVLK